MPGVFICILLSASLLIGHADQRRGSTGKSLQGRVLSVVDGDTIVVKVVGTGTVRVRIEGIDAPERGEPFSDAARRYARALLFDKTVTIDVHDVDRYRRLVAQVSIAGADAGEQIVRAGLACHFVRYSSDQRLATAQQQARSAGSGFWASGASKPRCVGAQQRALGMAAPQNLVRGNDKSRLYHVASCRNYQCKECTRVFRTTAEARDAGFRPARDCYRR